MVRRQQSIDGFVARPTATRRPTPNGTTAKWRSVRRPIDGFYPANHQAAPLPSGAEPTTPPPAPAATRPRAQAQAKAKATPEQALMNDIENALNQIDDIASPEGQADGRHQRQARRRHRTDAKAKTKKPLTKAKVIKRIVIVLVLALLITVGYLAVKAGLAGGKIFNGNPLSILTTKSRLAEDKNGRTNILIFGTSGYSMDENAWDGAMLTDSIMVVSLDQDEHNAYMMSLPRDLYIKHTCPALGTTTGKLNETFYCAYGANKDEKAGAQALMKQAGDILGLDVQYYIHADWTALVQAVNAVGGVDVAIESSDPRGIYDSGTKLRYKNGEVAHLDGDKALALARARNHNAGDYGLAGGNYDREKNQQKILAALQQKALSAGTLLNPTAVNGLIDSLGNNLITDFDTSHVQTLIDIANNLKADQIKQLPFVGRQDGGEDLIMSYAPAGSYVGEVPVAGIYDYSDIQAYIAQNLSNDPVVREAAKIDVLNGSGQVGLAADKAKELKKAGYTIGEIANAPAVISDKVVVYQINSNKTGTADALKKKLGVELTSGSLAGYVTDADFVIVYGLAAVGASD